MIESNIQTESEYMDTPQLATMLNVSEKSIIKWRVQGLIPGAIRCGRAWRFKKAEIEKRILTGNLLLPKNEL